MGQKSAGWGLLFVGLLSWGCSEDEPETAAPSQEVTDEIPDQCQSNADCTDGVFCNGIERCDEDDPEADDFGCAPPEMEPCGSNSCSERDESCGCENPDEDDDGALSIMCGGNDCDDTNPNRYPGNTEVCDPGTNIDEDCDPNTFGFRDQDGDTDPDAVCCNTDDETGDQVCGTDCDDQLASRNSRNEEICDDVDNDCDDLVDEDADGVEDGLKITYTIDVDGDGFGTDSASAADDTRVACTRPEGYVANNTDCDDGVAAVNPSAVDSCNDTIDNDCDDTVNNPVGGCDCTGNETRGCDEGGWVGKCATRTQSCNDGTWDDCPLDVGSETEVCDGFGVDEDCDGFVDEDPALPAGEVVDFGLRTMCYVDADGDGFAASTTSAELLCSCGANQTTVEPTDATNTDCSDDSTTDSDAASRAPGNTELCNGFDDNCDMVTDTDATDRNTYYLDDDSDSFGDASVSTLACQAPTDYVSNANDCNDGTSGIASIASCAPGVRPANTSYACNMGSCDVTACPTNLEDCNADFADDCETDITSSRVHCGGCTNGNGVGAAGETCYHACDSSSCEEIVQVAAGFLHTCGRTSSGNVVCWGDNERGQLGDGTTTDRDAPVAVSGLTDAVDIVSGHNHMCAERSTGQWVCWGENVNDELGAGVVNNESTTPAAVTGMADSTAFAAGASFTCGISTGLVFCWGTNGFGELGVGNQTPRAGKSNPATTSNAIRIAAGSAHACAIIENMGTRSVECWGMDFLDQLGDGVDQGAACGLSCSLSPVTVATLADPREISAYSNHTCVIEGASGEVYCWGNNTEGQLGDGSKTRADTPQQVLLSGGAPLTGAIQISAGFAHTCALLSGGTVMCWGHNIRGQLGSDTFGGMQSDDDSETPVEVTGVTATSIACGQEHCCATQATGETVCWGDNDDAEANVLGANVTGIAWTGATVQPLAP